MGLFRKVELSTDVISLVNILDRSPLRNFTELKFVLVTSQLCLLRFGVNFCMSYDFSLTSQSCLP